MHARISKLLALIVISIGLSACGFSINPYGISADNVATIKSLKLHPVAVEKFDSYKPGLNSIGCRAAGPVETADSISFESYIEKAFVGELKIADSYDPASPLVLHARLEDIDFNSNIGAGKWMLKLTVSSKVNPGYSVSSVYEFSTNWVADRACQQVAQAFTPAVQQLIGQIVSDPRFKSLTQ